MAGEIASVGFRLLGPPEAVAGGQIVAIGSLQQRARAAEAAVVSGKPADARPLVVELVGTLRQVGARRRVAEAFELAAIAFGDEQPDTGALALGAAKRLRAALGETPGPAFLLGETLATANERIKGRLGTERFAVETARGANLPVDEALAFVASRLGGSG